MKVYIVMYDWVDVESPTIQKVFKSEEQAYNYIESTGDTRRLYVEEHEVEQDSIENTITLPKSGKTMQIEPLLTYQPPPNPRCDGCKYQHPHKPNILIDETTGRVLCLRNINGPFIKNRRWIKFEEGQDIMICDVYNWDKESGLSVIKETT